MTAAALAAADPRASLARCLPADRAELAGCTLLAVGKAAQAMGSAFLDWIAGRVHEVVMVSPGPNPVEEASESVFSPGGADPRHTVRCFFADHPLPTEVNLHAAEAVEDAVRRCAARAASGDTRARIVLLLSGGASALVAAPAPGLPLDDLRAITDALLRAGAPIEDLNTVRKHGERLKGGRLAALAAPAPLEVFVLSDVLGDPLDVIGSGPAAPDPTTFADALATLDRYGLRPRVPAVTRFLEAGVRGEHTETPKPGDAAFRSVRHTVIANNSTAIAAAREAASATGFEIASVESGVRGEAREAASRLAAAVRRTVAAGNGGRPRAFVWGGETTVTVSRGGAPGARGGRCQEFALAAALELVGIDTAVVAAFATDGVDGTTDAAGAVLTPADLERAGLSEARSALESHDSHTFLAGTSSLIRTGPTGTNVNDLYLALVYPE